MISQVGRSLRYIRQKVSRSYWAIRLLKLSQFNEPSQAPGLVMVQIDGFSLTQFNRALKKGRLPFMAKLLEREKYILHPFYSGLPSNTPAVQGELFYGVKGCVPSFSFIDRQTRQIIKMFDGPYVETFEPIISKKRESLLAGGSAYSNIFTGGAKEAHFCWAQLGWSGVLHAVNPFKFPFLVVLYADIFIRTAFLLAIEFMIAFFECIRGTLKGRLFFEELRFVWLRVLVCVFLRELMVAGVCMDIIRGLPIIHLNFLGYDEQAHCRGPSSLFAHWSLQGIDDAIKRIDNVIKESPYRQYDLWIYADHGQARTTPYSVQEGHSIEEAVQKLFGSTILPNYLRLTGRSKSHAKLLRMKKEQVPKPDDLLPEDFGGQEAVVTAMGPLGQIYVKKKLEASGLEFFARKLVLELKIPLVLTRHQRQQVMAYTPQGSFVLPGQAAEVFGEDHPFLEDIKEDIVRMCWHPDAGEFIIAGWSKGQSAISFPLEYGAHAAMSVEETQAFALLPLDAPLKLNGKSYLRPMDLRKAVQRYLNQETVKISSVFSRKISASKILKIMSYNVHGCMGMDGTISAERIARVIARHQPDVIALQELDSGRVRSQGINQANRIAGYLGMKYHFHPVFFHQEGSSGNAILSCYPLEMIKVGILPNQDKRRIYEPRGALWVSLEFQGAKIHIINTHLSIWPRERMGQMRELLSKKWIGLQDQNDPLILCGDFNAIPGSLVYKEVCKSLKDSQASLAGHRPYHTWSGRYPLTRIDHIFINFHWMVNSIFVPRTSLDKLASDHLPLVVGLSLKG